MREMNELDDPGFRRWLDDKIRNGAALDIGPTVHLTGFTSSMKVVEPRLPESKPLGRFEMVVSGFVPDSAFKAGLVMPVDISGWYFSVERDGWVRP